jgi:uncharacterized SAM-binding protein YcdF (DUF218 family)
VCPCCGQLTCFTTPPNSSGLGVAKDRITLVSRSRDTYENALFAKRLIIPSVQERWLLITSAWHMPRAMGCFRNVGFPVEPWPVDYRTSGRVELYFHDSISKGLRQTDIAVNTRGLSRTS